MPIIWACVCLIYGIVWIKTKYMVKNTINCKLNMLNIPWIQAEYILNVVHNTLKYNKCLNTP
jgi:hypothetical protein